jgi:hypothetical protein
MEKLDQIITSIAREHLDIATLKTRKSDSLDFHDVAVWQVKIALKAAFEAGAKAAYPPSVPVQDLPTPFDKYEIHGVKAYGKGSRRYCEQVEDSKADYWSLFGHIPGQGVDCIGDFSTREHAEEVFARITGRLYAG